MIHQRISVVFWNETITVDSVEKRIPLRLPQLLKIHRLDWYGVSQSGLLLFNDKREMQFTDAAIIEPFLTRWQVEPPQPDVVQLKRYMDEFTVDPDDSHEISPRRRWAEIERRHAEPIFPSALLQLLSAQYATVEDITGPKKHTSRLIRSLLRHGDSFTHRTKSLSPTNAGEMKVAASPLKIREQERRRMLKTFKTS
ncbi:MAG: hypothetical protein AAF387_16705 [Pseudomonadota bacterium]